MMTERVYTKRYDAPVVDLGEALRYAGVREETAELRALLEECLAEMGDQLRYKICYTTLPVSDRGKILGLGSVFCESEHLCRHLANCEKAVVFAATVGVAPDRLVMKYGHLSPTKALLCQALATERIEALCDVFCQELKCEAAWEGAEITGRFSPGYGDLSVVGQRDIFRLLDCSRRIGLSLGESLLMSPTKSVTALVGIRPVTPRKNEHAKSE